MKKKALILDLDNTLFPTKIIGEELFKPLIDFIEETGEFSGDMVAFKKDLMRKPFQKLTPAYKLSETIVQKGTEILRELTYRKNINPYPDYEILKGTDCKKFLVTAGFTNMQQSKVKQLGIEKDFEEIHIADPDKSVRTKKDVFAAILKKYDLKPEEVLVIGDDPDSEIIAGKELGLDTLLYDQENFNPDYKGHRITNYSELRRML